MNTDEAKLFIYTLDKIHSYASLKLKQSDLVFRCDDKLMTGNFLRREEISNKDANYIDLKIIQHFNFTTDALINISIANKLIQKPDELFENIGSFVTTLLDVKFDQHQIVRNVNFVETCLKLKFFIFPKESEFYPVGFIASEEN